MVLPLGLLNAARKTAVLVEVKSGETFNGKLDKCDVWMNVHLLDVVKTSADGDRFWQLRETFIRGNSIKYIRLPDETMDAAHEMNRRNQQFQQQRRRGGGLQRGRGGYRGGSGTRGTGRGGFNSGAGSRRSENKTEQHSFISNR